MGTVIDTVNLIVLSKSSHRYNSENIHFEESSTYSEAVMFDGAFRSTIFVSWLLFIVFVSGAPKPGSKPKPGPKGSRLSALARSRADFATLCKQDYAACQLQKHNELRKKHGSPDMTINSEMNKGAEAWAKKLADQGSLEHSGKDVNGGNGENLWAGCGVDPAGATQKWYDEMTNPGYDFNNPGWNANPGTGHFTQVVWKASIQLGIGKAEKDGCVYVVGRYSPAGNMMGDFESNVLKPVN